MSVKSSNGFTILELLMVLAIIGLVAGLLIVNVDNVINSAANSSAQEQFKLAVRDARLIAVTGKKEVWVRYNDPVGAFEVVEWDGNVLKSHELNEKDLSYWEEVLFWPMMTKPYRRQVERDTLMGRAEVTIPAIRFHPTGVSHFVAVEWVPSERGVASEWVVIDAFSDAEVELDMDLG